MALERGAGAKRHDRQLEGRLIFRIATTSAVVSRKADDVRRGRRVVRLAAAVLIAHRRAGAGAWAEQGGQRIDGVRQSGRHSCGF